MIFLKKFNESSNEDCSFETFKDIMLDLSDEFDCSFNNLIDYEEPFYECLLTLPQIDNDVDEEGTYFTCRYLEGNLPRYEEPGNIDYNLVKDSINTQNENLINLKNNIDSVISNNNKIKNIFDTLENMIIPRFQSFSNFQMCTIGFDVDLIRICFDIKYEES